MADADVISAREADFLFRVGDLTADILKVTGFTGNEGLSQLFQFHIDLCSDDDDIVPTDMLGKACSLEICSASGSRWVNGIIRRFERTGEGNLLTHYAAEIVPCHWLLTRRHKCRIFQEHNCSDMTVPGIIKDVFEDAGIPEDSYRFALESTYAVHEYIVQYRESEMDFISRLMEEVGIFYFFEHSAEGHVMVIGDSGVAHVGFAEDAEVPFSDPSGLVEEKEFVFSLRESAAIQFGATCLDDFNFKQPAMALRSTNAAETFTALEYSDYPGEYEDKGVGDRLAQIRLEEHQCARQVIQMATVARRLMSGYRFTLIDHPKDTLNLEYLVTQISHRASQTQSGQEEGDGSQAGTRHELDVRCIRSDVPYRPPRVTPRPTVLGSQTARVTGPSGEEIYTDKYGRVKVKFHWDREGDPDETSSCWIRVSQGMAGGNYGMMFLPRVGQEVVVDFLEGNPDQPLITGRVYNNDHMPPYTLPDEKTKSVIKTNSSKGGGGTNEIRFEDDKGNEQLFLQAEKDFDQRTKNVAKEWVGSSRHLLVGGDKFETVGGDKHNHVKGDHNQQVDGTVSLDAGMDLQETVGMNHALDAGMEIHLKAGLSVVIEAGLSITLKAGGGFIVIGPAGVTISGSPVLINSGGSAGSGSGCSVTAPDDPAEADKSEPGKDKLFTKPPVPYGPMALVLAQAAQDGTPFCEKCAPAPTRKDAHKDSKQHTTQKNKVDIVFDPAKSDKAKACDQIGHVQVLRNIVDGKGMMPGTYYSGWKYQDKVTLSDGTVVDHLKGEKSPDYQQGGSSGKMGKIPGANGEAKMDDTPSEPRDSLFYDPITNKTGWKVVECEFETFAWCKKGKDCPKFYEGVKWKFRKTWQQAKKKETGTSVFTDKNVATPSPAFKKAYDKFIKANIKDYTPCK